MDMQGFINSDGSTTEDGRKLLEWIEAQFMEADRTNDVAFLSSGISGDIQHYYMNVFKTHMMSADAWLRDYRNSIAQNAWRNYQYSIVKEHEKQEQASQMEAQQQKAVELEAGMNTLQEALAAQKETYEKGMAELREEIAKLMAGGKKRASKATAVSDDDDEIEA